MSLRLASFPKKRDKKGERRREVKFSIQQPFCCYLTHEKANREEESFRSFLHLATCTANWPFSSVMLFSIKTSSRQLFFHNDLNTNWKLCPFSWGVCHITLESGQRFDSMKMFYSSRNSLNVSHLKFVLLFSRPFFSILWLDRYQTTRLSRFLLRSLFVPRCHN